MSLSPVAKRITFLIISLMVGFFILNQLFQRDSIQAEGVVSYSDFVKLVKSGKVTEVDITPSSGAVVAKLKQEIPQVVVPSPPESATQLPENLENNINPDPVEKNNVVEDGIASIKIAVSNKNDLSVNENILSRGKISTTIPPAAIEGVLTLLQNESPITTINVRAPERPSPWGGILLYALLLAPIIIIGAMYWNGRRSSAGPQGMANFAKSKFSMVDPATNKVRLKDVAGCDEAKYEVAEFVSILKSSENFDRVAAVPPKGVLMVGPPGTGKTLLAKAIAGEAGVPFFSVGGSDFVEMFVGVGAARIRSLYETVKANAPAILFIDEIDALGKIRSGGNSPGSNDEREQTLNQLLIEMDGFAPNSGIFVIAATNRADVLDPALRRPGRFDREVHVGLPDREGRTKILELHASKVPVSKAVDWDKIARGTPGFSGADLANLVNEAALHAARKGAKMVTPADLNEARDKIIMGVERKGALMNDRDRRVVAYHEAGHALVGYFIEGNDPIHKITIVPRGRALGVTMSLPDEDSFNHDATRLRAQIAMLLGGRAAEDVALKTATVGASNDFDRATAIARRMVGVWGMSELGTISVHGEQGEGSWSPSGWSEHWKKQVDDTAAKIMREEYIRATQVMKDHREALERVALALLEHETVEAEQFIALVNADSVKGSDPVSNENVNTSI